MIKVESEDEKFLSTFNINTFPTIILFTPDLQFPYNGYRSSNDIFLWVERTLSPADNELKSFERVKLISDMRLAFLLVIPEDDSTYFNTYWLLRNKYSNQAFFYTRSPEIRKKLKIPKEFSFIVFKDFDNGHAKINSSTMFGY